MRLLQRKSKKCNRLLAALTLVFWWGGYYLPRYQTEVSSASGDSQIAGSAAVVSTGEGCPVANNSRRIVPVNPANKFPQPAKSQVCGALDVFFLSLSRKPRPDDVPAPLTIIAWRYQVKNSDRPPLPPVNQQRPFNRLLDAYLLHCAFLI
jgi:hypothetical protein